MANLEELRTEILETINNPDVTATKVDKYINRCIKSVSGRILLAKLESENTVDTIAGVNSVSIPAAWNFQRNLFQCQVEDKQPILVLNSLEHLERVYPNYKVEKLEGPIKYIVVTKSQIIYYPIPSEPVTLVCGFYELPTLLVDNADIPECIPEDFHEDIIENFVYWKVWNGIENGIEGYKVNTANAKKDYLLAREDLEDRITTGQSRAQPNRRTGWV